MLVDGSDSIDGVLAYIGMAVLEARPCRGEEGFDELGLPKFAKETKGVSSDILVCVLEIIPNTIAMRAWMSVSKTP